MSRGGHDSGQNHQHIGQHQGAAAIKSCSATPTHPLHRTGRYPLPPARHGARVRWRAQGIRRERCAVGRTKKSARLAQKRSVVAASQPVAASQEERALAAAVGRRWGLCAGTAPDSAGCCRLMVYQPTPPTRSRAAPPSPPWQPLSPRPTSSHHPGHSIGPDGVLRHLHGAVHAPDSAHRTSGVSGARSSGPTRERALGAAVAGGASQLVRHRPSRLGLGE